MSNMSYCRFQNTVSDLRDCQEALENLVNGVGEEKGDEVALSDSETASAKNLLSTALGLIRLVSETTGKDMEDIEESDCDTFIDDAQEAAKEHDEKLTEDDDVR